MIGEVTVKCFLRSLEFCASLHTFLFMYKFQSNLFCPSMNSVMRLWRLHQELKLLPYCMFRFCHVATSEPTMQQWLTWNLSPFEQGTMKQTYTNPPVVDNDLLRLSLRLFKRKTMRQGSGPEKTEDAKVSQTYIPEICMSWTTPCSLVTIWSYQCFCLLSLLNIALQEDENILSICVHYVLG